MFNISNITTHIISYIELNFLFHLLCMGSEQLNTVETFKYLCIIKLFHYNENKDKPRIFSFKKITELLIHLCRFLGHFGFYQVIMIMIRDL